MTAAMANASSPPVAGTAHSLAPLRIWLFAVAALVLLMLSLGGATRLTGSGLSITEWKPIIGVLPPLTDGDWQEAFRKYQQIPQYEYANKGMSLAAFKVIFWWEWAHRNLGRLIGIAFALPFLVFLMTGRISRPLGLKLVGIFALGSLQGLVGWYMVSSGLTERIDVSHYRLALHLGLAVPSSVPCCGRPCPCGTATMPQGEDRRSRDMPRPASASLCLCKSCSARWWLASRPARPITPGH